MKLVNLLILFFLAAIPQGFAADMGCGANGGECRSVYDASAQTNICLCYSAGGNIATQYTCKPTSCSHSGDSTNQIEKQKK